MEIHVECKPDEALVKKIGFTRKEINHHIGKSRVFTHIRKKSNQVAMVDEDPGSPRHKYEKHLVLKEELHGIKLFIDYKRNNKVLVLKIKLEDWILAICERNDIDITVFGLPGKPNDLHKTINNRLLAFDKLLDHLIENNNEAIAALKKLLNA